MDIDVDLVLEIDTSAFEEASGPVQAARQVPGAPTVLIADDDELVRQMLVLTLGKTYTVYTAEDGERAWEIADRLGSVDLLLTDVMMPKLDGIALARRFKEDRRFTRTPVVMLTARTAVSHVVEGINAGARHYITKPFKSAELVDRLGKLLRTNKG